MINLRFEQLGIANQIFYIIQQLSLSHYEIAENNIMPFSIVIKKQNNSLLLTSNNSKEIKIQLPCRADSLVEQLEHLSKDFHFNLFDTIYYPLNQKLSRLDRSIKLNLIHNNIFKYLILNKEGISKANLYKIIWPKDKDYHVNKLDTHITNLKNVILKELDISIGFESSNGILKINN